jgi:hypothetical protein
MFNSAKRDEFLTHMRAGMQRGAAAEALGLTRMEVVAYIGAHEDYEAEVLDAEARASEHVMEALFQAAVSGHVPAGKLWLELKGFAHRLPTGPLDKPVDPDMDDELQDMLKLARKPPQIVEGDDGR